MKNILFGFISLLMVFSCQTPKQAEGTEKTPDCIEKAITVFAKEPCEKEPSVKEYTFQGAKVYVFDPGHCGADMTSEVRDKSCKTIGYLGGFTGNVKINGEDFSSAIYIKTLWEKQSGY